MVRLRRVADEFHNPDEFRPGTMMVWPYLLDMEAYQEYQDGQLDRLYSRMTGGPEQQDITGAQLYVKAGVNAYYNLNLFQMVQRYFLAAIWEENPVALDDEEALQTRWEEDGQMLIREARRATEWLVSKGDGVLKVEQRMGMATPLAVDPEDYVPLMDPIERDLTVGHALVRRWYEGPRLSSGSDLYNRATVQIHIPPELAALSDGRVVETMSRTTYSFPGGSDAEGILGEVLETMPDARVLGVWRFGNSDSVFKSMERNVYEIIMAFSHARTALTQDIRSTAIIPAAIDPAQVDPATGRIKRDLLRPEFRISVDNIQGSGPSAIGYLDPPGPAIADAFMRLADVGLDNLAYTANTPREAFGQNYQANEPADALTKLLQTFKTKVIDTRDDLSKILSEAFLLLTGQQIKVGWKKEPFANSTVIRDEIRRDFKDGIINLGFAQSALNYPIMEVDNGDDQRQGPGQVSADEPGGGASGAEDGADRDPDVQ